MAGTIKVTLNVVAENGNFKPGQLIKTKTITQTNQGTSAGVLGCTTTAAAIPTNDSLTGQHGLLYLENLGDTNDVLIGGATDYPILIPPGEFQWMRTALAPTINAKSDASTTDLYYQWFAD